MEIAIYKDIPSALVVCYAQLYMLGYCQAILHPLTFYMRLIKPVANSVNKDFSLYFQCFCEFSTKFVKGWFLEVNISGAFDWTELLHSLLSACRQPTYVMLCNT